MDDTIFYKIWLCFLTFNYLAVFGIIVIGNSTTIILNKSIYKLAICIAALIIIACFGFRSPEIGTDTIAYYNIYDNYTNGTYNIIKDFGFYIFVMISSFFGKNSFLLCCAFVFIIPLSYVFYKKASKETFIAYVFLITSFYFFNMGINIMRQGIGISFMLLSLYLYVSNKKIPSALMALISVSLHLSIILAFVVFFISRFSTIKGIVVIYFISLLLSLFAGNVIESLQSFSIFNELFSTRVDSYFNSIETTSYKIGFRYDFAVYNTFFLVIGLWCHMKGYIKICSNDYSSILKVYGLLSSIFFLSFHIPYSDRIGIISWVFIPFVLAPVFSLKNRVGFCITILVFVINTLI